MQLVESRSNIKEGDDLDAGGGGEEGKKRNEIIFASIEKLNVGTSTSEISKVPQTDHV